MSIVKYNHLNLYIDLDGVILDVSEKLYQIYKDLMIEFGGCVLSKKRYWDMKRIKTPISEILNASSLNIEVSQYLQRRNEKIEDYEYLIRYDKLIPGAFDTLQTLKNNGHRLILVTLRKSPETLEKELIFFKIKNLFSLILSPNGSFETESKKAKLIETDPKFQKNNSLIIGDTEADILSGKILGITSVAVSSGIRTGEYLRQYEPDFLIKDVSHIFQIE